MQINILSRKFVKPSKPTPSHLRTYNISAMDEINPSIFIVRILYYKSSVTEENLTSLEESFARTLSLFYPLAGRYDKEKRIVDCNDEGALFSIADVEYKLDQLMDGTVEIERHNVFLPLEAGAADELTDPMLAVQINRLQCGSTAIAICASHRIFDSGSVTMFLKAWSNAATGGGGATIVPVFDSSSFFPSENLPPLQSPVCRTHNKNIIIKRLLFTSTHLSELRRRLSATWKSTGSSRPPSRVVIVSAFLSQALIRADRARFGRYRPTLIAQAINARGRTIPPVPDHSFGSWATFSNLELNADESREMETDFVGLSLKIRESAARGVDDCRRLLTDREFGRWALVGSYLEGVRRGEEGDCRVLWVSDWSKFGDYEVDLGFGKPVWLSYAGEILEDVLVLMNTKDNDGMEAWLSLHESDMRFVEQDEEIQSLVVGPGRGSVAELGFQNGGSNRGLARM